MILTRNRRLKRKRKYLVTFRQPDPIFFHLQDLRGKQTDSQLCSCQVLQAVSPLPCAELWIIWWVSEQMHSKHMLCKLPKLPFQSSKTGHHTHYKQPLLPRSPGE